jgi:hypothetical protein
MLLDFILLSPERRYVCYQETHVKTACSRSFTLSGAAAFILQEVNYNVASFYFPDMRCDLLNFFCFIFLALLSCFVLKFFFIQDYVRLPCITKTTHEEWNKKTNSEEKKAGK